MKEYVSVVVPVYNVEDYLSPCIDSILNQTYENMEIILVDDGSTDSSSILCDKYAKKDKRIKVVHKKNGGLSDARNTGIDMATGKYITFIDSDDFLDKDFIKVLLEVIINNKADLAISNLVTTRKRVKDYVNNNYETEIIEKESAYKNVFLQDKFDVSACGKLYKKSLFNTIKYPVGELYEDFLIIDKIFEKSNKIVYTNYRGYYYYMRDGSIMHGNFSPKRMILIDKSSNLVKMCEEKYPNIVLAAIKRYIYSNFVVLGFSILSSDFNEYIKKIKKNIVKYKKLIFKCKYFTFKDRFATFWICIGIVPYRFFWKIYKKFR